MAILKHKPNAVLLDWDDHLVDSTEYYKRCSEQAIDILIKEYGYATPSKLYRERGQQTSSEYFLQEFGKDGANLVTNIRETILMDSSINPPELRPGAKELLSFLELNNIPYAIVSDTAQSRLENNVGRTLKMAGLSIPTLVGTSDELGIEKKPAPDGILYALNLLSEKFGIKLQPSDKIIMSGDQPTKDGMAAKNAKISHAIIVHEKSGNTDGWHTYENLHSLLKEMAATLGQDVRRPKFIKRDSYKDTPRTETEILCPANHFIESPLEEALADPNAFTPEEKALHNLRWIAKKARNLDGSGNFTRGEQMEAAYQVIDKLLTDDVLDKLAQRVLEAIKHRQKEGLKGEAVIHLPHRVVNPPKPIENMLSVAYNHELSERLNKLFAEKYPAVSVRFDSSSRLLSSLSMHKAEEFEQGNNQFETQSLSTHDTHSTVTLGRSTGNLLDRIVKQPIFDYSTFKSNDLVIITDDHVQGGGTFVTWYHALKQRGVVPIAFSALSTMPESKNLQPHQDIAADMNKSMLMAVENYCKEYPSADRERVTKKFFAATETMLSKVGISLETLSSREALTLMAYIIDGNQANQLRWFESVAQKYGCDLSIVERQDESLVIQAAMPPVTPLQLLDRIEDMIPTYTLKQR